MSIDWYSHHRAILGQLTENETPFETLQEKTSLTAGALASVLGGLMAKKCVFSTRPGYFEITYSGKRYLTELTIKTSERRTKS